MDEKLKRIIQTLNKEKTFPSLLEIRPSATCNLKCVYCDPRKRFLEGIAYAKKNNKQELVSKEVYLKKIKECSELGITHVHICGGGEPFIRTDIISLMEAIKKEGLSGNIITNGTLFNKSIIKNLVKIEWDSIMFSLDGPNKSLDNLLRGETYAFNNTITSINQIVKKGKNKPKITLAPVISNRIQYKITEFINLAKKLNVDKLLFQPVTIPQNFQKKFSTNKTKRFKDYLIRSIKLAKKYSLETNLEDLLKFYFNLEKKDYKNPPICFESFYRITVQPNGNADPCPIVLQNPHKEIKNVNIKYKSLKSIWDSFYFKNFRKRTLNNKIPNKRFCKLCCGMVQLDAIKIKDELFKEGKQFYE